MGIMQLLKSKGITTEDIVEILFRFIVVILMTVVAFIVPAFKATADTYYALGLIAIISTFVTFYAKLSIPGFNKLMHFDFIGDKFKIGRVQIPTLIVVGFAILAGILTLFRLADTSYIVTAPFLQIIQPNPVNTAFLSGLAGIIENIFFFSFLWEFIYVMISLSFFWASKNPQPRISFYLSGIVIPWIFLLYHNTVYGIDQRATSQAVVFFGYEMVIVTGITKNYTYAHMRHFFNNFALALGQTSVLGVLLAVVNSTATLMLLTIVSTIGGVSLIRRKPIVSKIFGIVLVILATIFLLFFIGNIGIFS